MKKYNMSFVMVYRLIMHDKNAVRWICWTQTGFRRKKCWLLGYACWMKIHRLFCLAIRSQNVISTFGLCRINVLFVSFAGSMGICGIHSFC